MAHTHTSPYLVTGLTHVMWRNNTSATMENNNNKNRPHTPAEVDEWRKNNTSSGHRSLCLYLAGPVGSFHKGFLDFLFCRQWERGRLFGWWVMTTVITNNKTQPHHTHSRSRVLLLGWLGKEMLELGVRATCCDSERTLNDVDRRSRVTRRVAAPVVCR